MARSLSEILICQCYLVSTQTIERTRGYVRRIDREASSRHGACKPQQGFAGWTVNSPQRRSFLACRAPFLPLYISCKGHTRLDPEGVAPRAWLHHRRAGAPASHREVEMQMTCDLAAGNHRLPNLDLTRRGATYGCDLLGHVWWQNSTRTFFFHLSLATPPSP